jgi:UDP-N-acetylmuramoyl-L-alanyl-D-glutamate--2,6-diaminopimelate ligase
LTWSLRELWGEEAPDLTISHITLDSRSVVEGTLFAALPGTVRDGRDFIQDAVRRGARAILALPGTNAEGAALLAAEDPARALAWIAARAYPNQPPIIIGVTGTNGKSSTVDFLRQIWRRAGLDAASLGTLGVRRGEGPYDPLGMTTPDALVLHQALDTLARAGVTHLAMESSSHGLVQRRLDGVRLSATGFSNLTQDHFDYHGSFEAYFEAKARLFDTLAPRGTPALINVDGGYSAEMLAVASKAGLDVRTLGWSGEAVRLVELMPQATSQTLSVLLGPRSYEINLPLVGEFQVHNALMALGLAIATGVREAIAVEALGHLEGVRGRLELAGLRHEGDAYPASIFVDYAHTPDGLDNAIRALRPHTKGRLICAFGCGGDRDRSKRAKMGAVAARHADVVIVTDDNPRTEEPSSIRGEIMTGAPQAHEIGDRAEAIAHAIEILQPGDCCLIAGKGHETGQIVGDTVLPFDDVEEARRVLAGLNASRS